MNLELVSWIDSIRHADGVGGRIHTTNAKASNLYLDGEPARALTRTLRSKVISPRRREQLALYEGKE